MKKIGSATVYVQFDFGSFAYISVPLYEGKDFEQCIKMRSERVVSYLSDEGKWVKI